MPVDCKSSIAGIGVVAGLLLIANPSDAFWCCQKKVRTEDAADRMAAIYPTKGVVRPPISTDVLSCTGVYYVPGKCVDMVWKRVEMSEATGCIHVDLIGRDCAEPVRQPKTAKEPQKDQKDRTDHMDHKAKYKWLYPAIRLDTGKFRRATTDDKFWHAFLPRGYFDPMPEDPH